MHSIQQSILKVIAYFDVFDYPVKPEEIKFFLDQSYTEGRLAFALQQLCNCGTVYRFNNYYSLKNDYALVERRIKGNALAEHRLKQAKKVARFLMRFPFIKGIAISGSLSKNFATKESDLDFFIITAANRLWIARMFFICFLTFAKMAGLQKMFCLNYFIDEAALEIPEKNLYTAIEVATLKPVQGTDIFKKFFEANKWVYNYLPNHYIKYTDNAANKSNATKIALQWLLHNKTGNRLNTAIMQFYKKRWEKMMQQKKYAPNGFRFGSYIAGEHVCKPIPHFFQEKILSRFDERMKVYGDDIYYTPKLMTV